MKTLVFNPNLTTENVNEFLEKLGKRKNDDEIGLTTPLKMHHFDSSEVNRMKIDLKGICLRKDEAQLGDSNYFFLLYGFGNLSFTENFKKQRLAKELWEGILKIYKS